MDTHTLMNFSDRMGTCCRDSASCLSASGREDRNTPHSLFRLEKFIRGCALCLPERSISEAKHLSPRAPMLRFAQHDSLDFGECTPRRRLRFDEEPSEDFAYEIFRKLGAKLNLSWNLVGIEAFAAEG